MLQEKNPLDKDQWSSPGQAELGKGTQSFGIFWYHPGLGALSEGEVPKGEVWDLFEKSGKMAQPHSQDAPEALILSWSTRQEFLDLFSMREQFGGVDFLWGCYLLVQAAPTSQIPSQLHLQGEKPGSLGRIP